MAMVGAGTADPTGSAVLKGEDPGEPGSASGKAGVLSCLSSGFLSLYPI
jgi:hypothetical protein